MSRLLTAACALLLLSGAAACSTTPSAPLLEPHSERSGPAGPVPAGLERYYGQQLDWGPCADYATSSADRTAFQDRALECARLQVPLDHAHPEGRQISIGVLRKPATDPDQRIGSLLMNPGGPGASGMSAAASLGPALQNTPLGTRFDQVGFDPRGIGASEPAVRCLTDQEWDADRLDSDADPSPEGTAETEREVREYSGKCAQRTGTDVLAHVGTRDVVQDMDVLRSALGDPKLTYLGYSYGTRIGSAYAEQYPGNVRAMILDGAIDPSQDAIDEQVLQGAGFQRAFDSFARWCTERRDCALGPDPARATAAFQRLARPLLAEPVPAGDRKLSYTDATTAVIQALYAQNMWPALNTGLEELARGRGTVLLTLADSYYGRDADGTYSNITDAFNAVRCVDDPRVTDRNVLREADRRYREAAPFLDDGLPANSAMDMCSFWPVPVTGEAEQPSVSGLPPLLVISTTGDPATPYDAGVHLAEALRARLLTFEGTQHTAFLQGDSCVDQAGIDYLTELELPAEGTRCT
ncbi:MULTISPECIES: alpha/beta hydrolase [unclassified Saccharopolyspora]|uniref:alpha/beta hydrolase n=1 Tax=unclassified Saccharopolyspora TaxID=2646250 RepID=UPI001CD61EFA|nr:MULTISPECIES: alpha/beta hydrolase [unclassified Saccharopolyspora]MCA1192523.1 alpha/beta hydrolase [Saccharopolyspora sp. 6V]MCA1225342.1 alpha/beta hydrolase [Saccharopolyspora sp. 6M]